MPKTKNRLEGMLGFQESRQKSRLNVLYEGVTLTWNKHSSLHSCPHTMFAIKLKNILPIQKCLSRDVFLVRTAQIFRYPQTRQCADRLRGSFCRGRKTK